MRCGRNYEPALAEDTYCPRCGSKIISDFWNYINR
jgi:DNA-directed RNA polymerase subunit RPC12/RpoP